MGLTIHYSLHVDVLSAADARRCVERLRQAAMDLPFAEVGDVIELTGDAERLEKAGNDEVRWLLIQAMHLVESETNHAMVPPQHVIAFTTRPGPGCEAANFGICRYPATVELAGNTVPTHVDGWHWESFCKTQYASNPSAGGVENFLRCHLAVIKLLDRAREMNLLADVKDEGEYWERRDVAALTATVRQWNQHLAGLVGQFTDSFGDHVLAPIRDYPDFEHLEADGQRNHQASTRIPRPGDRIQLTSMRDDPDPIPVGQTGTVVRVYRRGRNRPWYQIDVAWDNGRALMLASPPDEFKIIGTGKP